jgi:hypothetical protein
MAYQLAPPNNFKYHRRPDVAGIGALLFAGSMVLLLGLLNIFYAISVIAGSEIFIIVVDVMVIHALAAYGGGGRPLHQYYR